MKIGVMTFWWSQDNYGQLLQCYALQKYLRDLGHDAYLIRYDPRGDYVKSPVWKKILKAFNPIKLRMFLLSKKRRAADIKEKRDNPRDFEGFRDRHIRQSEKIYYSYKQLVENPPEADMYIVGSDQVWSTSGLPVKKAVNKLKAYLLNFGSPATKRVSYAASFGKTIDKLDPDFIYVFTSLLKNFDYVLVREKSGLEICRRCGIDSAEWVPDPTLLLDADTYRALYAGEKFFHMSGKRYCFLYLVGNDFNFSVQSVYDWAYDKGLEIVYVTGNSQQDRFVKKHATIPEWLYLLEHAECVITNSFHCAVFSLLFGRKFAVIPLAGRHTGMNSRLNSLFQQLHIEERFLNNDFSVLDMDVDRQAVSETLKNIKDGCILNEIICRE